MSMNESTNASRVAKWRRKHPRTERVRQYKYIAKTFVRWYATKADMNRLNAIFVAHEARRGNLL